MAALDYLAHLRDELRTFSAYLDRDLSTPIRHCGDWTLYDLADHLGSGNLWTAVAVTEGHGDLDPPAAPRAPVELAAWFDDASAVLLKALDADPSAPAWTFFPPPTVGFWQRRRALETLVHRWDVEQALGIRSVLDPTLAGDGVAEVFDTLAPRQVERGRAAPPSQAVRLTATDTGSSWTQGPGEPVATISASAAELLLLLWGRLPADDPAIRWAGDRAAGQVVLDGTLTP